MSEVDLLLIIGSLCVYMFLGFNSFMMILEWKAKPSESGPRDIFSAVQSMLSKQDNPNEYLKARFYTYGALLMILGAVILSKLEGA